MSSLDRPISSDFRNTGVSPTDPGAGRKGGVSLSAGGPKRARKKKRRERSHGNRPGKTPQWKVFALIVSVCAGAALIAGILFSADYESVANYVLFGDTDPKISAARNKELASEFKDMLKKEFGPK